MRRAMGITDGSSLSLSDLGRAADPREIARLPFNLLSVLHVERAVNPDPDRSGIERALHLRLSRCMALFMRRLALTIPPASRRRIRGV